MRFFESCLNPSPQGLTKILKESPFGPTSMVLLTLISLRSKCWIAELSAEWNLKKTQMRELLKSRRGVQTIPSCLESFVSGLLHGMQEGSSSKVETMKVALKWLSSSTSKWWERLDLGMERELCDRFGFQAAIAYCRVYSKSKRRIRLSCACQKKVKTRGSAHLSNSLQGIASLWKVTLLFSVRLELKL